MSHGPSGASEAASGSMGLETCPGAPALELLSRERARDPGSWQILPGLFGPHCTAWATVTSHLRLREGLARAGFAGCSSSPHAHSDGACHREGVTASETCYFPHNDLRPAPNPIPPREIEQFRYLVLADTTLGSNQKVRRAGSRRPRLSPWSRC